MTGASSACRGRPISSIVFLFFGAFPLAFAASGEDESHVAARGAPRCWSCVPVIAAVFVARTATVVDAAGITRAPAFGSRGHAVGRRSAGCR